MARKRTELSVASQRKIEVLLRRGGTAKSITKVLRDAKIDVSESTVQRRIRELRQSGAPPRVSASDTRRQGYASSEDEEDDAESSNLPSKPEEIPEDADLVQIERWLKRAERMAKKAVAMGDIEGMAKMGRLTSALLELKRKATPIAPPDPNESPDMIEAAENARVKLHHYLTLAMKGAS